MVREYEPLDGGRVHGVTFDGKLVWFARDDEIVAFDPDTEKVVRRLEVPAPTRALRSTASTSTRSLATRSSSSGLSDGRIVSEAARAWQGSGQRDGLVGRLPLDRPVPGVEDPQGGREDRRGRQDADVRSLRHRRVCASTVLSGTARATTESRASSVASASDGAVEETLSVPVEHIAGVEATGEGSFWCGGEKGKLRLVRKKS